MRKEYYRGFILFEDYDYWDKIHKYYFREGDNYFDTTKPLLRFDSFYKALEYAREYCQPSNEIYIEKGKDKWVVYDEGYEKIKE